VKVMRDFAEFRPVLVGSVLSGTAGQYSDVNLQLFTDDPKALTMFLLNKRVRFEEETRRVRRGMQVDEVPQITIVVDDVSVSLTVLDPVHERLAPRRAEEEPQRARLADVEALLERGPGPPAAP
jgi:hypothetical protein